jgi:hypothetical protein
VWFQCPVTTDAFSLPCRIIRNFVLLVHSSAVARPALFQVELFVDQTTSARSTADLHIAVLWRNRASPSPKHIVRSTGTGVQCFADIQELWSPHSSISGIALVPRSTPAFGARGKPGHPPARQGPSDCHASDTGSSASATARYTGTIKHVGLCWHQ